VNIRFAIAAALFIAQASCDRHTGSWGSYPDGNVKAEWLPDGRSMKLLETIHYIDANGVTWTAPKDAVVDGASIPQEFWTFIGGPFEGKYRNASVFHDVACNERKHRWEDVHHMFYDGMRCSGVEDAQAKTMFWAVWNFGPKWNVMLPMLRRTQPPISGTPTPGRIQKPKSPEEVRAIYERIKRENPTVSDIEKGKL
jgi:Protein of unknown function (DUF1353)